MAIDQKYKDGYVTFVLPNVEVFWAHVHRPDTAFGGNKWSVEMHLLDQDLADSMKAAGFNVKSKEDKNGNKYENVLTAKREVVTKSGEQKPPSVVGLDGKTPFTEDIGNGSKCNVKVSAKAWKVRGSWILALYLEGIQVVEHVPYSGGGFDDLTKGDDVPF